MKIRNGWVSNSSSSSFIVQLSKPIEQYSLEEFMEEFELPADAYNTAHATTLFRDLQHSEFDIDDADLTVYISHPRLLYEVTDEMENRYRDMIKAEMFKLATERREKCQYLVEYNDEQDFGAEMEHQFMPNFKGTIQTVSHH